jgi:ribonuclease J
MTNIIFYGGVGTIGGNCVILEEKDSRIMIDNGMCFSTEGDYYKDFLSGRMGNGLRDLLDLDLVPKIAGLYGKEKLIDECIADVDARAHYMLTSELESYESFIERTGHPYINALILSHLHLDHIRNLIFMPAEIPVVCSQITKDFLEIISDLTNHDFLNYNYSERKELTSVSYFPNAVGKKKAYKGREFIIAQPNEPFEISGFELIGYPVDHSVPGAMAFKVKTPDDKVVVYTGDIRFHGHDFEKVNSENFVKTVNSAPVDVLISEGTRIGQDIGLSEAGVYKRVAEELEADKDTDEKMIFTSFPWKSISRFLTVLKIAKEIGRILVVHPKLAYVLHHFKDNDSLGIKDIIKDDDVKIYKPRKTSMLYSDGDYSYAKQVISFDIKWKRGMDVAPLLYSTEYGEEIFVTAYEIHDNPEKYILHLEFYSLSELIDIQPPENSYYFNLKTEPFDEEGLIEEKVLKNWMNRYKLNLITGIHASGHASGKEILDMINKINPKKVFPVHTAKPESFNLENSENDIEIGKKYPI